MEDLKYILNYCQLPYKCITRVGVDYIEHAENSNIYAIDLDFEEENLNELHDNGILGFIHYGLTCSF